MRARAKKKLDIQALSTKKIGDALEQRVQQHSEALGYKVVRDALIDGHQIDLLATKYFAGGVTMSIAIECKHREGTVGVDEVTEFFNTATHLINAQRINCAVMVTNAHYIQQANGLVATSKSITLATGMTVGRFQKFLYGVYDIEDLMRRALLLKMIIETALSADASFLSEKTKRGPASLYELYTQRCSRRDVKKATDSQYLTKEARLRASRMIAISMFKTGRIPLQANDVREVIAAAHLEIVESLSAAERQARDERALTDLRPCSFLKLEVDGALAFAHKSYLAFFVTPHGYLQSKVSASALQEFSAWPLGREHLYFLGSSARDRDDFCRMIRLRLREAEVGQFRDYLLRAAGWTIGAGRFDASSIAKSSFCHCKMWLNGNEFEVDETEVLGSNLHVDGDNWTLSSVKVKDRQLSLNGAGRVMEVTVTGQSEVTMGTSVELSDGSRAIFDEATVVWLRAAAGCRDNVSGTRIQVVDCTGLVIVRSDRERKVDPNTKWALAKRVPESTFIDSDQRRNDLKQISQQDGKTSRISTFADIEFKDEGLNAELRNFSAH